MDNLNKIIDLIDERFDITEEKIKNLNCLLKDASLFQQRNLKKDMLQFTGELEGYAECIKIIQHVQKNNDKRD